jgi:transposase
LLGKATRHGGITKRGRKRLWAVYIQAVLAMVNRTETPMMEFYRKKKEKGAGKAICATARKLLTIIFVSLKKELELRCIYEAGGVR